MSNPVYSLTYQEYRIALDASSTWLAKVAPTKLYCENNLLCLEASQRLNFTPTPPWQSALWIEPQIDRWEESLKSCSHDLGQLGHLAVIISQPLAKHLPGRVAYGDQPLGFQRNGMELLLNALQSQNFQIEAAHHIHTYRSILTNQIATVVRGIKLFAWADRLEFIAKKQYIQLRKGASKGTCALILAAKTQPH